MSKIVESADLKHLLSPRAHLPNHSLLSLTVELSARDMGWTASLVRRRRRDIEVLRMYNQIVNMEGERVMRKVFELDCRSPQGEWSTNVQSLASSLGCENEWNNRLPMNLKLAEKTLKEMYEDVWQNKLLEKPKLRTYCKFKENISAESHLTVNLESFILH